MSRRYETTPPGYKSTWRKTDTPIPWYYWVIVYNGEHVNGGIAENEAEALRDMDLYRYRHIAMTHIWDEETSTWSLR